jgi:ferric-dicitrate binding protein FerR (iron transport regulator)
MKEDSGAGSNDFIHNREFIDWVIHPDSNSDLYWARFKEEHPELKGEITDAVFIIKSLLKGEKNLDKDSAYRLWKRIEKGTFSRRKTRYLVRWMAAASVVLALGIGGAVFYMLNTGTREIDYSLVERIEPVGNEIKLILSDKSEKLLADDNSEIKYDKDGTIEINATDAITEKKSDNRNVTEHLNQLVVPLGKRSSLILSDGTKLWLNSGSRAIYPVTFSKKERKIFIEGEAFFEVAHDAERPFFVVTNHLKVRVLGTKFNVNAYPKDPSTMVVLVEGSIQASVSEKKVLMKENQLFTYEPGTGFTSLEETDVLEYISWKDGWMYCNRERMENIATRLSRYYNVSIRFKDPAVKELTLTGKLDLKNNCEDIFKAIRSTAPIRYEMLDDGIVLSKK